MKGQGGFMMEVHPMSLIEDTTFELRANTQMNGIVSRPTVAFKHYSSE